MSSTEIMQRQEQSPRLRMAQRFGVNLETIDMALSTIMPGDATHAERAAVMIIADQYKLNPITKEVHAFKGKGGNIVPVVGVDGWVRIANEHPQYDGVDFEYLRDDEGSVEAITTIMYRKDRTHPTRITEWMSECRRSTPPWQQSPIRMLRHKSYIQCARVCFGFSGIYDPDEAERIRDVDVIAPQATPPAHARKLGVAALAEGLDAIGPIDDDGVTDYGERVEDRAVVEATQDMVRTAYLEGFAEQDQERDNPFAGDLPELEYAWSIGNRGGSLDEAKDFHGDQ